MTWARPHLAVALHLPGDAAGNTPTVVTQPDTTPTIAPRCSPHMAAYAATGANPMSTTPTAPGGHPCHTPAPLAHSLAPVVPFIAPPQDFLVLPNTPNQVD